MTTPLSSRSARRKANRIGQILIESKILNEDQLRIALREQANHYRPLGKLLVELGFVSEAMLSEALSKSLETQTVDLETVIPDPDALALVPYEVAKQHNLLPLSYDSNSRVLTIAIADPRNILAFDQLRMSLIEEVQIETFLAGESEIASAVDQYYRHRLSIDGILREMETGEVDQWSRQEHGSYSQPATRLLFSLLSDAVKQAASDIHFEPEPGFLRIRYRKDGLLRQIRIFHISYWPAILVRIKLMAKFDIVETRLPQNGHFSLTVSGRAVDFRVSIAVSVHGENVVIRVLDRQRGITALSELDLTESQQILLRQLVRCPEGLVLFVGPPNSGKTTTMYSVLGQLNLESVNIMTIEDPVEYPMSMVRQTTIWPGFSFSDAIVAIRRQNPDVLAIGQISSAEIAEKAFFAGLSGMLVLSTLDANSVFHAISCLRALGLSADMLSCGLTGLVGQRLIRKLCPRCRLEDIIDLSAYKSGDGLPVNQSRVYGANGCHECDYTGYRGQTLIAEILKITPVIAEMIYRGASLYDIVIAAKNEGFVPLSTTGLQKVFDGETTIAEYVRVCGYDHFFDRKMPA